MDFNLDKIKKAALDEIKKAQDQKFLEELRIKYLGRKGELTEILKSIKDLSEDAKRQFGPLSQKLKKELEEIFEEKLSELKSKSVGSRASFDVTRPGEKIKTGHLHPLTKVDEDIRKIFLSMNFSSVEGPEVETEYYNFDALNIPAGHPAREMWDTFWLKQETKKPKSSKTEKLLLRTHTSPMQVRYMEKHNPPFQIIVPGRVFRYEATDATHEINFYQVEGLMIGKDVNLANFKFVVEEFFKKFFGNKKIKFRFRPSFFPFVEPGLEVDIKLEEKGKWLEVMGAGMVHREVFKAAGYNPDDVAGFAFGVGVERLAMIKYKINDIRLFYSGDLRFINQGK